MKTYGGVPFSPRVFNNSVSATSRKLRLSDWSQLRIVKIESSVEALSTRMTRAKPRSTEGANEFRQANESAHPFQFSTMTATCLWLMLQPVRSAPQGAGRCGHTARSMYFGKE